jgi:hypothetical protein
MAVPVRRVLLFLVRGLQELGYALGGVPMPRQYPPPRFTTAPGHPERVVPLSLLSRDERLKWEELENQLW